MGMRATTSHDTILDRVFVPDEATALVCPAGFAGAGMFQVAMFAWALLGFAGVYAATARRAFDDTVQGVHTKQSVALTRSMAYHPEVQHHVAEMRIHLEAVTAHLDRACDDWSNGVDHGMEWPAKILACKHDDRRSGGRPAARAVGAGRGVAVDAVDAAAGRLEDGQPGPSP